MGGAITPQMVRTCISPCKHCFTCIWATLHQQIPSETLCLEGPERMLMSPTLPHPTRGRLGGRSLIPLEVVRFTKARPTWGPACGDFASENPGKSRLCSRNLQQEPTGTLILPWDFATGAQEKILHGVCVVVIVCICICRNLTGRSIGFVTCIRYILPGGAGRGLPQLKNVATARRRVLQNVACGGEAEKPRQGQARDGDPTRA